MIFPWLQDSVIDAKTFDLLQSTFASNVNRAEPVDLDAIVAFLSEKEELSYIDDADLGMKNGDIVLGKTQPLKRRILISKDLKFDSDSGRARFTLAHELGHWVLHRLLCVAHAEELSLFGAEDTVVEFVGLNKTIFPDGGHALISREEWQANRFAISLLIDSDVLRVEFVARFGNPVIARQTEDWRRRSGHLRDHARLLGSCEINGLKPLRKVFGLSAEAIAIALETRGYAVEVNSAL